MTALAKLVSESLGRPDLTPEYRPERAGDLKHSYADLSHAREVLGYKPIVPF